MARFFFICDRWMAVEEDDGMVERILPVAGTGDLTQFKLPVAGTGDLTQFKQLFNKSVRKKMTNDHLWVSVFSRPTRSSFTRVQRISCCVALLFLTMITNCMFFKAQDPDHATEVHIGPITLTLQQLYISIVSTLIVFPPSLTIVTIFRKVRLGPQQSLHLLGFFPGSWNFDGQLEIKEFCRKSWDFDVAKKLKFCETF